MTFSYAGEVLSHHEGIVRMIRERGHAWFARLYKVEEVFIEIASDDVRQIMDDPKLFSVVQRHKKSHPRLVPLSLRALFADKSPVGLAQAYALDKMADKVLTPLSHYVLPPMIMLALGALGYAWLSVELGFPLYILVPLYLAACIGISIPMWSTMPFTKSEFRQIHDVQWLVGMAMALDEEYFTYMLATYPLSLHFVGKGFDAETFKQKNAAWA